MDEKKYTEKEMDLAQKSAFIAGTKAAVNVILSSVEALAKGAQILEKTSVIEIKTEPKVNPSNN